MRLDFRKLQTRFVSKAEQLCVFLNPLNTVGIVVGSVLGCQIVSEVVKEQVAGMLNTTHDIQSSVCTVAPTFWRRCDLFKKSVTEVDRSGVNYSLRESCNCNKRFVGGTWRGTLLAGTVV